MTSDSRLPVLVVEDDPNDVVLLQRAFRRSKLANPVVYLGDGEAARAYLAGENAFADRRTHPLPVLILLDLKLPRLSGLDLLAWLRDQTHLAGLPVVILTSSRETRDVETAYSLGANSYLVKPVAFDALLEVVQAVDLYWLMLNQAPTLESDS
jgi:DNA-binding response OmpR family regulator